MLNFNYHRRRGQQASQEACKYIKQMYFKDFDKWNIVKKRVHTDEIKVSIRAGEIRWVSFGVNVGSEIDGKANLLPDRRLWRMLLAQFSLSLFRFPQN